MRQLSLMLDSGAFSAWTQGTVIDLDHYIAFIKANIDHVDYYVNLDVIPGAFGVTPSAQEVEASAQAGWDNMLKMEAEGLKPIPVFHMGEQFKWLRRMVEHGCPFIGISPANDRTTGQKRVWLDRVFHELTDESGRPIVKTHGFGVTALSLLTRYPWFSADSTSWRIAADRGCILVPQVSKGKWVWDKSPDTVYVSTPHGDGDVLKRSLAKAQEWKQIPSERATVLRWIAEAGSTLDLCATDYKERTRLCCHFFQEFERNHVPQPFKRSRLRFFEDT